MATAFDRVASVTSFNTQSSATLRTIPSGRYGFMYIANIEAGSTITVNPQGGAGTDSFSFASTDIGTSPRVGHIMVPLGAGDVISATASTGNSVTGLILEFNTP